MQVASSGGVSIGNTTDPGATNLSVTGTGKFGTTVGVGATTPSASGAGITFPATQSASTDANTLDDYEEGTWTPTIIGTVTAGTGTYTAQTASYTKIGNLVTVQIYMAWTAHTGSGSMRISGLPFTSTATRYNSATFGLVDNITLPALTVLQGFLAPSSAVIELYATAVGGGAVAVVTLDTAGGIMCGLSYMV